MTKYLKRIIIVTIISVLFTTPAYAANTHRIVQLDDSIQSTETCITDLTPSFFKTAATYSSTKTITKTKTMYIKNSAGSVIWLVSVTATFTYNGHTSKCIRCTHKATSLSPTWKINKTFSTKSNNHATATAIATHFLNNKRCNIKKSVTIKCSPSGIVS